MLKYLIPFIILVLISATKPNPIEAFFGLVIFLGIMGCMVWLSHNTMK